MSGKVIKYLFGGISWGCVVSCIVNVIGTMVKGNAWFTEAGHSYAAQVAAAVLVGVGWVLPSVIYQSAARDAGTHPLCDRIRSIFPDRICDGLDPRRYFNWRDLFGNASDGSDVICDLDLFLRSLSQRGKADQ